MSRLPSLNGLRAFEAAARHLSFTKAAEELNVTQTAISHQIKRLEEELGLRLFVRQNRTLTLTAEARDYLPGIRAAFQDLRLATERMKRKDNANTPDRHHARLVRRQVADAAPVEISAAASDRSTCVSRRPPSSLILRAMASTSASATATASGPACARTG